MRRVRHLGVGSVPPEEVAERFWSKVNVEGECWLWLAATRATDGIGVFGFEGRVLYAHRVAYLLTRGTIPEGLDIRRTCSNLLCVRPFHLTLTIRNDFRRPPGLELV